MSPVPPSSSSLPDSGPAAPLVRRRGAAARVGSALATAFAVLAIVLALLWLTLQWGILPNLHRWRAPIEAQASRALGLPVTIGAIRVRSTGLMPHVELDDVIVHDPSKREALRLARVQAAVSPRTVLNFKPHFEQLVIDGATLDVRRDAEGRLHVAGIEVARGQADDERAASSQPANWLFEQREFVIRNATVRWTDERRGAPPLALSAVDFVVRNRLNRHDLRLDATPPASWGDRFTIQGHFQQPWLGGSIGFVEAGDWRQWIGTLHVDLPRADVSELRRHASLPFRLDGGRGALRAWLEVDRGDLRGVTADVALGDVDLRLADGLEALDIQSLQGRVIGRRETGGLDRSAARTHVALDGFTFTTRDGRTWPRGDLRLVLRGDARAPTGGELEVQRLDLSLMALVALRLPLPDDARARLQAMQPRGHVERLVASWDGALDVPRDYRVRAKVTDLDLEPASVAIAARVADQVIGRPGVKGATIDLDATRQRGSATVAITAGHATFPGILERPTVDFDRLDAQVAWTFGDAPAAGPRPLTVQVRGAQFANADLQGRFDATWRSGAGEGFGPQGRYPGALELDGQLQRGKLTAAARYLPLGLPEPARRYVAQSIVDGRLLEGTFRMRGDLTAFPFRDPNVASAPVPAAGAKARGNERGEFKVAAKVDGVRFDLAPQLRAADGTTPAWPLLEQVAGEIVFDRTAMQIRRASGKVQGLPAVQLADVKGDVVDFAQEPQLAIDGVAKGPLQDMLRYVARSPVEGMINRALAEARVDGAGELELGLRIPFVDPHHTQVRGAVKLAGNDVRIRVGTPVLEQARGRVEFTETGFTVAPSTAKVYGHEASFEGGLREGRLHFEGRGVMSAEGLARARDELGEITRLATVMKGQAPYRLALDFQGGEPEFTVDTSLVGVAVDLPAPLRKAAEASLPLRVSTRFVNAKGEPLRDAAGTSAVVPRATRDLLRIEAGSVFQAHYLRDRSGESPQVLAGAIGVGEPAPPPADGVRAIVRADNLDLDAWQLAAKKLGIVLGDDEAPVAASSASSRTGPQPAATGNGYTPRVIALHAKDLMVDARRMTRVTAGLSQDVTDASWRATLDADQFAGYAHWRPPRGASPARLEARLARLALPASASESVDAMLSDDAPSRPPALDIVIDDFELRGRKLGKVEIEATSERAAGGDTLAWTLNKLRVSTPEARLAGAGRWVAATDGSKSRRMVVDFKLDLDDSGAYLGRFGLPGVIAGGRGVIGGQISWAGSPITWHAPSLAGAIHLKLDAGQFLKVGPGAARLLGVLNLQSLPRRLLFDFRDVFSDGFAFDGITGDVKIAQGVASTNNLRMRGVQALVLMEGTANVMHENQDLRVWVVPEIDAGTASLAYAAINPAIGLGTFLAQLFLRRPLMEANTREFRVQGSWDDPKVERVERKPGDRIPGFDEGNSASSPAAPAAPSPRPTAAVSAPTPPSVPAPGLPTPSGDAPR